MSHQSVYQPSASRPDPPRTIDLTSPRSNLSQNGKPAVDSVSEWNHAVDLTSPVALPDITALGEDSGPRDEEKEILLIPAVTLDGPRIDESHDQPKTAGSLRTSTILPLPTPNNTSIADDHPLSNKSFTEYGPASTSGRRPKGVRPPKLAVALPGDHVADYYPWTGHSSEDVLNENVVRSGYADKPTGSNQSESHTARPSLWPNLKQKTGLPILSALLVQVMEKRQASGRCNTPSTFKPPPRVTLTDAKRESWLRDLASPDVPLRRLSRTIPHGIRGRALLDQCLAKQIPLDRALWLAKCVGANELRAFRRKGVSGAAASAGENKWIREWTLLVEQFFENTILCCGQANWRSTSHYAIRFTAAFYTADLLDTEHYLDWLLASFRASSSTRLPVWTIMVQIHWGALIAQHRRGRLLSEALLAHLVSLEMNESTKVNAMVVDRLERLVIAISTSHGECMIGLHSWVKYQPILEKILHHSTVLGASDVSLRRIICRNERLRDKIDPSNLQKKTVKSRLVAVLDSAPLEPSLAEMMAACRRAVPDFRLLVQTLLEWASSVHATGSTRSRLVTRLLRTFKDEGLDLEGAFISSLSSLDDSKHFSPEPLGIVLAGLVQTSHFAYGRYLLWIISQGRIDDNPVTTTHLLVAVPDSYLSLRTADLRQTITRRLGLGFNDDYDITVMAEAIFKETQAQDQLFMPSAQLTMLLSRVGSLRKACQLSLSSQLQITFGVDDNAIMSLRAFVVARVVYEHMSDFESLHLLLRRSCESHDTQILASIADTVNLHAETFGAMGVLKDLVSTLYHRQRMLRLRQIVDRNLLLSLSRLLDHCQSNASMTKSLAADLAVCEQQVSSAACSPASDNIILANAGVISSDDDIDRILLSGNMMDEQLMARLFSAIVERCVKQISSQPVDFSLLGRWFTQLRSFDRAHFDRLSQNLLSKLAGNAGLEQIRVLLTALVGSNCMDMSVALSAWERRVDAMASTNEAAAVRLSIAALQVFLPKTMTPGISLCVEQYRFNLAQTTVCRDRAASVMHFLKQVTSGSADLTNIIKHTTFRDLLCTYAIKHASQLLDALTSFSPTNATAKHRNVHVLVRLLFDESPDQAFDQETVLSSLMSLADEYSMPICKVAMRCMLCIRDAASISSQPSDSVVAAFKEIIEQGNSLWLKLVDSIPADAIDRLHRWGLELSLQCLTGLADPTSIQPSSQNLLRENLAIVAVTGPLVSPSEALDYSPLIDGLAVFDHLLEIVDNHQNFRMTDVASHIEVSIRLITAIVVTCPPQNEPSGARQCGRLLLVCCRFLCHRRLQSHQSLCDELLDICCLLAANLDSTQLSSVARQLTLQEKMDDRVKFLTGTERPVSSWLALASRVTFANTAASSPTTTQGPFPQAARTSQPPTPIQRSSSQTVQSNAGLSSPGAPQAKTTSFSTPQHRSNNTTIHELKYNPFVLRPWEMMRDPTTSAGENDTSLSLTMFAARRAL